MERKELINIAKIITNIFLAVAILLLVWQFFKADDLVKDIALYNQPESLVTTYENLTGYNCLCGPGILGRINNLLTDQKEDVKDLDINISLLLGH